MRRPPLPNTAYWVMMRAILKAMRTPRLATRVLRPDRK